MSLVSSIVALAQAIGDDIKSLIATLDGKVDKVPGKGLSENDYTTADKDKLAGVAAGATANAGTVTSVGLSVPTGFAAANSPITSSGTIAVTYAAGYGLPTTAKQSQWDTAYGWGNHASAGYSTQTLSAGTGLDLTSSTLSVKYGTASGTAAQGNDSRITGAFPASGGALTGGATGPAAVSDGTKSSGTYTPSPGTGNWRKITNGGAHTIAAPTTSGCYNMTVDITNNSSAGAITFSGFVTGYPKGDDLTTTNGNKFKLHIFKSDLGVTAFIEALQ